MRRLVAFAVTISFVTFLVAPPAGAAFPGANGKIAYDRYTTAGRQGIFTIDPDGTNRTRLGPAEQDSSDPAWSADGLRIAFRAFHGKQLRVMDADGSNVATVLHRAELPGGLKRYGDMADPAWSPDGTALAFSALHHNLGWRVFMVGTDGTGLTRLTDGSPSYDVTPAWSPNGTTIAAARYGDIALLAADGSTEQTIVTEGYTSGPDWSPTGAQLVFSRVDTAALSRTDIFTMNADGSGVAQVTDTPERWEFDPCWSPDGTRIVYSRSKGPFVGSTTNTWTIAPDGSSPERLTNSKWYERSPNWQPV
jgi:Tol biopolymer transport system component